MSLGCHVEGAILPAPNPNDQSNMVCGVMKRVGCMLPKHKPGLVREIRSYVRAWLRRNLTPLAANTDVDVGHWLEHTKYEGWRKKQLARSWHAVQDGRALTRRHYRCSSFVKREHYDTFKYPRSINSRSDPFKCLTGPYFHAIEEELYKLKWFVKQVSVRDRPKVIADTFRLGEEVRSTDYSSFEASVHPDIMYAVEMQLYSYMLQNLPNYIDIIGHIRRALLGRQNCQMGGRRGWQGIRYRCDGTRMSGDMCTSLGNGFLNLMLMSFACTKLGGEMKGLFEGDDGLCRTTGLVPGKQFFEHLGFNLKIDTCSDAATASFCGNVFVRGGSANVTHPIKGLLKFGWSMSQLRCGSDEEREGLLRAKALSLLASNPGTPILQELALWVLRVIGRKGRVCYSGHNGAPSWWEQNLARDVDAGRVEPVSITREVRVLTRDVFGVSIETQERVESWLKAQTAICPIPKTILGELKPEWSEAWTDVTFAVRDSDTNRITNPR